MSTTQRVGRLYAVTVCTLYSLYRTALTIIHALHCHCEVKFSADYVKSSNNVCMLLAQNELDALQSTSIAT